MHQVPLGDAVSVTIVPDGHIDLQWIDGKLRIAGPDQQAVAEMLTPGSSVVGFRFAPGAAAAWLGIPATELLDGRVVLEDLTGKKSVRLRDAAQAAAASPLEAARVIEAALMDEAAAAPPHDASLAGHIFAKLRRPRRTGQAAVKDMAEELGLSERTLRRHAHHAFGYGVKTLDRILRFQRFIEAARSTDSLASVANRAGYADQAHLTRETQRMTGLTPGEIVSQLAA